MTLMFLPQFSCNVARFWNGVATDFFLGGGWWVEGRVVLR